MNKLKFYTGVTIVLLAMAGLWRLYTRVRTSMSKTSKSVVVLPLKDKEEVLVNSLKHTITVVTPSGLKTEFAKNPTVEVSKSGEVTVNRNVYGLELSPFVGLGYGDGDVRLHCGASLFYLYRLEGNIQLAFAFNTHTPAAIEPVLSLSYNIWDNTSLFVGSNPTTWLLGQTAQMHVGVMVKF